MSMKYHPELDGEIISKLGALHYKKSELSRLEQYGIEMSDYWHGLLIDYGLYSIHLSVAYILFIYIGQMLMKNRRPFDLRLPMTLWNCVLAVVSIVGTIRSANVLLAVLRDYGFYYSVCHPQFYYNSNAFWGFLFIISKPIELGDTVFIVLRKQPLIFLHWYHHITVMLYVFISFYEHSATGMYFYVINYGVHAIMYTYYTLRALRIRLPKFVPICVTSIQLSQMVFGSAILLYVLNLRLVYQKPCQISNRVLYTGLAMYLSYFLLFGHFFYQAYFRGKFWSRVRRISKSIYVNGTHGTNVVSNGTPTTNGTVISNGTNGSLHSHSNKKQL